VEGQIEGGGEFGFEKKFHQPKGHSGQRKKGKGVGVGEREKGEVEGEPTRCVKAPAARNRRHRRKTPREKLQGSTALRERMKKCNDASGNGAFSSKMEEFRLKLPQKKKKREDEHTEPSTTAGENGTLYGSAIASELITEQQERRAGSLWGAHKCESRDE